MKPAHAWWGLVALVVVATPVPACAASRSDFNDNAALTAMGFNNPITATINMKQVFDGIGRVIAGNDSRLAALFVGTGALTILPNIAPEGYVATAPWFHYKENGGIWRETMFSVVVGQRRIAGRSNIQRWSEGAIRLYAETITYSIVPTGKFAALPSVSRGPHSIRLVFQYDPAVGSWQLSNRSQAAELGQDASTFVSQVAADGVPYLSILVEKRAQALTAAFNGNEVNLAQLGILARDPSDSNVLVSKRRGLAYYIRPNTFGRTEPFPPGGGNIQVVTLREAQTYCSSVQTPGYRNWRLPTWDEIKAMLVWEQGRDMGRLIDVPDGRLWGALATPDPRTGDSRVEFLTLTAFGFNTDLREASTSLRRVTLRTFSLETSGKLAKSYLELHTTYSNGPSSWDQALWNGLGFRVICVASTRETPSVDLASNAPASGGVWVQVGAFSSQAAAEEAWGKMVERNNLFSGLSHLVIQEQSNIGTFYRLQVVTGDAAAASELCSKLIAAGQPCQVR